MNNLMIELWGHTFVFWGIFVEVVAIGLKWRQEGYTSPRSFNANVNLKDANCMHNIFCVIKCVIQSQIDIMIVTNGVVLPKLWFFPKWTDCEFYSTWAVKAFYTTCFIHPFTLSISFYATFIYTIHIHYALHSTVPMPHQLH